MALMTAVSKINALPPLLAALMKSFSNFMRKGDIITDAKAPTVPPIAQQTNKTKETPSTVTEYKDAARIQPKVDIDKRIGTDT